MNALADVSAANRLTSAIEAAEARRLGLSIRDARPSVARRLRAAPGTIENIRRMRLKRIPSWLMDRLRSEFIAVLQHEIQRLQHEITVARQTGMDDRDDDLATAQAQLEAAKSLIGGTARPRA